MNQLRLKTVVFALLITLCLLLGGYYLYQKYYVRSGLEEQINQVVSAEEVKIDKQENPPTVYVRSLEIKNLQSVYEKTAELVHRKLGPNYRIVFLDKRTPKLRSLYENSSFVIQEGIATGSFQEMHQKVLELADRKGVQCHLTMDSSNIYLEFKDDQGYLYEVIPRLNQLGEREKTGGEGV